MPRRTDIETILVIGSGPIVIGQACEFDYSGTQACRVLAEDGFRVVLINPNPATIMTDPETADRVYLEPLTRASGRAVIERERPQALLPTLGGQTALNLARELALSGTLDEFGVELIGADLEAIERAEDRERFHALMQDHKLAVPRGGFARSAKEARRTVTITGFPAIVRPAFTLGGRGSGVAQGPDEFERLAAGGLAASPIGEILVEESVLGWKEFELEVMRDRADNCIVVCSIENLDPMGVHTGDSITVAPQQTLTDREFQVMRDTAFRVIRAVGVETGGSNIQFAVDPATGRQLVIEMNPRVSRSSALASKATGFPIAKIAALLAVGYTLDEIPNDITRETPASFEPTIDYVVAKVPRFDFAKFEGAEERLTTAMKSVGETMAIGRTFGEAIQKAMRGLEIGVDGVVDDGLAVIHDDALAARLEVPGPRRVFEVVEALSRGWAIERVRVATGIDPWFLYQLGELVEEPTWREREYPVDASAWRAAKSAGFSDRQLARRHDRSEATIESERKGVDCRAAFKVVDTCAGEFAARTPYFYSSYDPGNEVVPLDGPKIVVLGGGPNRIGQGIEFDYCCVQAAIGLREIGHRVIMVNSNPETVSTDYDISDRLYFEPLTFEDVMAIVERERPDGVLIQYGGQTPLNLARALDAAGVPIVGTSADAIDRCEDRGRFADMLDALGLPQPRSGIVRSREEAEMEAARVGYPVLLRPSYVLGGRGMRVVRNADALNRYWATTPHAGPDRPLLIDEYLEGAVEVDVDALADGTAVVIGGIMQHIEEAGVHSGDSTCVLPPHDLGTAMLERIRAATRKLANEIGVRGLMNVQFAVRGTDLYVLEVNPRASRTVPFVSKAVGLPLARIGAQVMAGRSLAELGLTEDPVPLAVAVKAPVFVFDRFPGADPLPGPEMRSTGEVLGMDREPATAFLRAQEAAGIDWPAVVQGGVLFAVAERDIEAAADVARTLARSGARLYAAGRSARVFAEECAADVQIVGGSERDAAGIPEVLGGAFSLVVQTDDDDERDGAALRRAALEAGVLCVTSMPAARFGALAAAEAGKRSGVRSLQEWMQRES